ncbi:MAG: hypothetical protein KDK12_15740 [Rhodobacteraceae bacterium]|nr:hypothetical protein [Paracoccaceae bacterium]
MAHLTGPFRVFARDGADLTPRGQVRRALLAVLLTAPDQMRTRAFLTDMFWAHSGAAKAAASLRTALSELRKDLAVLGADCLVADRYGVRLAPGRIAADCGPRDLGTGADFLEGMDLQLRGAEGFEDWLRAMRVERAEVGAAERPAAAAHLVTAPAPFQGGAGRIALALLPCRVERPQSHNDELPVNLAIDRFLDLVTQLVPLRLYDYRDHFGGGTRGATSLLQGTGPRLMLEPRAYPSRGIVSLRLIDSRSHEVVWQDDLSVSGGGEVTADQLRLIETLVDFLLRQPECREEELLSPYQALVSMFHLKSSELDSLQSLIGAGIESEGQPVHHALLCYLATIRSGERLGTHLLPSTGDLLDAARLATRPGSFHAYCLSMSGYALGYLAGEMDLATEFAEKAVRIAPEQAFCWDQLALCLFNGGAFDAAAAAANRAQALGAHSPLRYTYDTTAAIVAFARGDYLGTVRFGNRALFRMPRFSAALRYTAAALAHLDQLGDSRRVARQLRLINPGANVGEYVGTNHLPKAGDLSARLASGLRRAGLQ